MPGLPTDPNGEDWQERWLARFEVRIDKRIDDFQQSVNGRLDNQDRLNRERFDAVERAFREHVERAGHSGDANVQTRVARLENWIMGLLVGVLTTASGLLIDLLTRAFGGKP